MQRVLIVGKGTLFDEGLKRLLSQEQTGLEVSSLVYTSDDEVRQQLLERRPSVVVLFEGGPMTVGRLFELIDNVPHLVKVRVITVLTESSTVEVYERQQIAAVGGDELLQLIEHSKQDEENARPAAPARLNKEGDPL